jgi:ubiquinone/menaquinone biosynthesis C-methylase UbiE
VADFPANGFDCIILPQTLRIVYHAKSFLEAIYRLLKPGGVLLATLPGIGQLRSQD